MNPKKPAVRNAGILVKGNTIVAAGRADTIRMKYPVSRTICFKNAVLLPGLVNLHTHLELPSLLDATRAKTFPDWVLNIIREKRKLKPGNYVAAARRNIETLIRTGTSTVAEICTHGISPAMLKESGLRAVLFQEVISMDPASELPQLLPAGVRPSSLTRTGISPHAPYTVSENMLRQIKKAASRKNSPLSMHLAESKDEIRLLQGKKSGFEKLYAAAGWDRSWAPSAASPFIYLHELGLLGPGLLGVHAVQITEHDIALIRKTRTPIAHCPRSNKQTGIGKMPLKKMLDAGIIVGLGTDSLASSPSLSLWDEMRYAYRIHRHDGVAPGDILSLATLNGARALGLDGLIGSIEPGKRADLIAVPLPARSTGDIYSDLIRETKSSIMTIVNGKIIWKE